MGVVMRCRKSRAPGALCRELCKSRFADRRFLAGLLLSVIGIACVGVPASDSVLAEDDSIDAVPPDPGVDTAGGAPADVAPPPIPVADVTAPTPIHDRANDPTNRDLIWLPGIGYAALADIYALMLNRAQGGGMAAPDGYTYLERLCLDQGYSDTYCRSRYGGL